MQHEIDTILKDSEFWVYLTNQISFGSQKRLEGLLKAFLTSKKTTEVCDLLDVGRERVRQLHNKFYRIVKRKYISNSLDHPFQYNLTYYNNGEHTFEKRKEFTEAFVRYAYQLFLQNKIP